MHMALRAERGDGYAVDGEDVVEEVLAVRERMLDFVEELRADPTVRDVVNIGIGGSDLGPAMAVRALRRYASGPRVHFVSNVDRAHLDAVLAGCDPASTRFIIASKTFTTAETMRNADAAKDWVLSAAAGDAAAVTRQFAAVSSAVDRAVAFGVREDRVFGFEDWVGGRFSMWGPVGCAVAVAIGAEGFRLMLAGARAADVHVRTAPLEDNVAAVSALIGTYNAVFLGHRSWAVLPYAQDLDRLPAFLQQADMESNGKGVGRDGMPVEVPTSTVVWGEPGTNGQHAFHQLLHQGTDRIPVDFIAFREPTGSDAAAHRVLFAHALAQAEALLIGRSREDVENEMQAAGVGEERIAQIAPHRTFTGNRPSSFWCWDRLDPFSLGMLVALQEHRIFFQGILLGVYSFDQWGVELGKGLAGKIESVLERGGTGQNDHDSSTAALMAEFLRSGGRE
jgi:glucose-6-phosphate isomerase